MKVALVHDYIKEFGGAERVLKTLADIFPNAPIYTAFAVKNSTAYKEFKDKKIIQSWLAPILKIGKLYSPLRFLIPFIWGSFDLSNYDLVITSCSWYITRGFKTGNKTKVVAYCHTPPRWLYGYETSVGFTKYLPVKIYAVIVGHFLRLFDFQTAQKINYWIANSKNVALRIEKFYRKNSIVIYPPVDVENIKKITKDVKKKDFFVIASRLVGAKGIEEAVKIFSKLGKKLYVVGEMHGYADTQKIITRQKTENIKMLGYLDDEKKYKLMAQALGFIALARDEDFGMTVVEAQAAGTPVIAYNGGGFKESVVDENLSAGRQGTGVLINEISEKTLKEAIVKVEKTKWDKNVMFKNAQKFSKEKFIKKIQVLVKDLLVS